MLRFLILGLLIAFVGCSRRGGVSPPTPEPDTGGPKAVAAGDAIGSGARELNLTDSRKLIAAFDANPKRAAKEYAGVRWRLPVRVEKIGASRLVIVMGGAATGQFSVQMRSDRELEKLDQGKFALIEARLVEFNYQTYMGIHFDDGICVSVDRPPSPKPIEGKRELDPANFKEVFEAFDRGGGKEHYAKVQWKFSGKAIRKVEKENTAYLIDVPGSGVVKMIYPGAAAKPAIGGNATVEDAVAIALEFDGDKPVLCFEN
ncbi:MAG: hypothetical protein K8U57_04460 [Planctomycetes bacterium]|nr:hypothetical protein [Planctomycetota bacterium]